ncbi:MAG: DUF1302 domain-containing protein, partial [Dechloromonas sp.]
MFKKTINSALAAAIASIGVLPATGHAFSLDLGENMEGSFNSTITAGVGKRMQSQSCSLV